eukprot:Cvel_28680.t1-p1 / transcript=Cvel_28680.t1 / gene=Cvel_28680 / organism=Chromera_velia_CCMP2878 / gene_product=hypothetical protein / transcript_product=hypothetical protein / location=Cvel_scaffold3802:7169-10595(+) / protein_length=265 / sequence_SO=supercontig / SO=protein_coding / is_pseudo=false
MDDAITHRALRLLVESGVVHVGQTPPAGEEYASDVIAIPAQTLLEHYFKTVQPAQADSRVVTVAAPSMEQYRRPGNAVTYEEHVSRLIQRSRTLEATKTMDLLPDVVKVAMVFPCGGIDGDSIGSLGGVSCFSSLATFTKSVKIFIIDWDPLRLAQGSYTCSLMAVYSDPEVQGPRRMNTMRKWEPVGPLAGICLIKPRVSRKKRRAPQVFQMTQRRSRPPDASPVVAASEEVEPLLRPSEAPSQQQMAPAPPQSFETAQPEAAT